jgi:hypothetical protein
MTIAKCQCGKCTFQIQGPMHTLYICHCLECRKQSASAFGCSARYKASEIGEVKGPCKVYLRPLTNDIQGHLHCTFCTECGSRLLHKTLKLSGEWGSSVSVKAGAIEGEEIPWNDAVHIWTSRAVTPIPSNATCFPKEPTD